MTTGHISPLLLYAIGGAGTDLPCHIICPRAILPAARAIDESKCLYCRLQRSPLFRIAGIT